MRKSDKFLEEVRERTARMVLERLTEYDAPLAATESISGKYCVAGFGRPSANSASVRSRQQQNSRGSVAALEPVVAGRCAAPVQMAGMVVWFA